MASDTSVEALRVQREAWRALGSEARLRLTCSMSEDARRVSMAGLSRRHPEFDGDQIVREFVRRVHGIDIGSGDRHDSRRE